MNKLAFASESLDLAMLDQVTGGAPRTVDEEVAAGLDGATCALGIAGGAVGGIEGGPWGIAGGAVLGAASTPECWSLAYDAVAGRGTEQPDVLPPLDVPPLNDWTTAFSDSELAAAGAR